MALSGTGWDFVPATLACQPVGGLNARNQCADSWQQGVKRHDTITGRRKLPVNVRCGKVGVTGGYVVGADASKEATIGRKSGKANNRHNRKRAFLATL